jgi:alkylation response protein AidB-like acyl-CoA dehydrogenase
MGRVLLCAPYFASVCLAANAIMNAATTDQQAELLPGIATGTTIATLAFTEANGGWGPESIAMEAHGSGDAWTLSGSKLFVIDGRQADVIVVIARLPGTVGSEGISCFVVDGDSPGLVRAAMTTMDLTRKQAALEFSEVPARLLGVPGGSGSAFVKTMDQATTGLVNEMAGGAQRVLDMAVEYAKERVQFGRPIGSFQAIKHKCADMLIRTESLKSAAYYAAMAAAENGPELAIGASLAKAYCSDAYFDVAAENVHVHGGIGFTWEHDAHLYYRRAKASQVMLGDAPYHRELLAQRLGV